MTKNGFVGGALLLATAMVAAADFSVRDYGAKGDGIVDDSPAFQQTFDKAVKHPHAVVRIPAGTYRLGQQVSVKFSGEVGEGLAILGEGQGVSVIHCANTNGALRIRNELCKTQVTVRDLTLLADIPGAGTALEVSSSLRGVRNYRTLTVENMDMRGAGLPTRNYFNRGLNATAQWRPLFRNVIFSGVLDPALNRKGLEADPLRHAPEYGFCADWSYAPVFQHCYSWACHTGYRVVSRDAKPEGPEDAAFLRCTAVGTRIGIDIDTPIIEPQLVIDSCHLNCRETGVRLANRKFFHVVNCLFYTQHEDQQTYTDLSLANCWAGRVEGNMFHSPHPQNMQKLPLSKRTCIEVDGKCRHIDVTGNTFNGKGMACRIAAQARNIKTSANCIINRHVDVSDTFE